MRYSCWQLLLWGYSQTIHSLSKLPTYFYQGKTQAEIYFKSWLTCVVYHRSFEALVMQEDIMLPTSQASGYDCCISLVLAVQAARVLTLPPFHQQLRKELYTSSRYRTKGIAARF